MLSEPEWRARQAAHEARVRRWTDPQQERAARGEKHPVYDFLFTYYAFRPAWLRRWHPGPGVALTGEGAREFLRWPEYTAGAVNSKLEVRGSSQAPADFPSSNFPRLGVVSDFEVRASRLPEEHRGTDLTVQLDPTTLPPHRREFVTWLRSLLVAMQSRPAFFGCHGWHEWAMVYRQTPEQVRHNAWPLRFPPEDLAAIVERTSVCCSHFDAFRFFTAPAAPLNKLQPTRAAMPLLEQRGCLHANMDLYKWAFKLAPFTPSELIADCFELARDIREIDMRASPYDIRALGFEPIAVETPEGRAEYEARQRSFTSRGEPLRARLIELCDVLLRQERVESARRASVLQTPPSESTHQASARQTPYGVGSPLHP